MIRKGKTSLCTYLSLQNCCERERRQKMKIHTNMLKIKGYNIEKKDYSLYSNFNVNYDNYDKKIKSQIIDIKRLGLGAENSLFIRPYSTIAITEAQTFFGSNMIHRLEPEQIRYFAESGHFGIDIILDCPRGENISPDIRRLCENFIIVNKREIYAANGRKLADGEKVNRYDFSAIKWHCVRYDNESDFINNRNGENIIYKCDYNIFDCYNPFSNYEHFLPVDKTKIIL